MIDRLKNRELSDDKGELVTRADGSQAVRTRKRKRRSNQAANKEAKRNLRSQIIQIAGVVLLLLFAFLAAGAGILYANSRGFREGLIAKAEDTSGAEVALYQFRMNPATANASKVTMIWPENQVLGSLQANSVVAKIAPVSFLGKKFNGEEITAAKGELVLKAPTTEKMAGSDSERAETSSIRFSRYSIPQMNIFLGGENRRGNMLENTEASFFPNLVQGGGEIRLNQGLLKVENWPSVELDRAYMNVRNKELHIQSMRFKIPTAENQRTVEKGSINFSGVLKPLDTNATHTLTASLESFRLTHLLGKDLGRFFSGSVITKESIDTNFIKFTPGSGEEALLEVAITHAIDSRIDLTQFRFLGLLSATLEDRWYDEPNFDGEASALVRRQGESVELDAINFEKRGRMALRGSISSGEAGQISGTLRVGIPESMIGASKDKHVKEMFGPVREGYRWIDLAIGGTGAAPTDNFKALYDAATPASQESNEDAAEPDIGTADSFEDLIKPQ